RSSRPRGKRLVASVVWPARRVFLPPVLKASPPYSHGAEEGPRLVTFASVNAGGSCRLGGRVIRSVVSRPSWRNGRRFGLKIRWPERAVWVRIPPGAILRGVARRDGTVLRAGSPGSLFFAPDHFGLTTLNQFVKICRQRSAKSEESKQGHEDQMEGKDPLEY